MFSETNFWKAVILKSLQLLIHWCYTFLYKLCSNNRSRLLMMLQRSRNIFSPNLGWNIKCQAELTQEIAVTRFGTRNRWGTSWLWGWAC